MKILLITFVSVLFSLQALAESPHRVLCYDRFEDEIWLMEGAASDDVGCKAMLLAGTIGMCFEGDAQKVADLFNSGTFVYSESNKVHPEKAEAIDSNVIKYVSTSSEAGFPRVRDDNEIFRCPEFDEIKSTLADAARSIDASVEYAVSRRYRTERGMPRWFSQED